MNYGGKGIKQKKKLLNSATTKLGTKLGIFFIKLALVGVIAIVVSGACLLFGSFQGIIENAPDIASINVSPEGFATRIYDSDENEIQSLSSAGANRTYVTIDQIPKDLQHAFIAIEDERFYEHNGIDMKGILRAASITLSTGHMSQGASTITQQLLKNNVFNAYNESDIEKIKRKVQEQYLAIKLETVMDKQDILENYLNTINLGNGYYGVQAAANGYFNKDVSELTLSECAVIASITKSPTGLNPIRHADRNKDRQNQVLANMKEQGYISDEEYNDAISDDVYARLEGIELAGTSTTTYSYFVDELINQLTDDLMTQKGYTEAQATNLIYRGGLQVYSTQDTMMQDVADDVINNPDNYADNTHFSINYSLTIKDTDGTFSYYSHNSMANWYTKKLGDTSFSLTMTDEDAARAYVEAYKEELLKDGGTVYSENLSFTLQPQISFTIMDQSTGQVKVMVGGRGDKTLNRSLNRASNDVTRQPGSSIKPLVAYGPALDTGALTLASAIDDAPYYYSGTDAKLVTNYTKGEYRGLMTVREALTLSQNVPAVKALATITPQVGFNYLEKFGISTLVSPKNAINGAHDVVQSLALGGMTKGVSNIDMCAAYAAIANKGTYTKPIYYTKVLDSQGNIIIDNSVPETHKVLNENADWLLIQGLRSVVTSGTGRTASFDSQPVAGKTGTTQYDSDRWFCGFTPYYTAAIWVGYDDNSKELGSVVSHNYIWRTIMQQIHNNLNLPTGTYEQPAGIVEATVCSKSGLLPVEGLCDNDPMGNCIITEYFTEDTVPTEYCTTHTKVTICNDSGNIATSGCPNTTTKIMRKKAASTQQLGDDAEGSQYKTWDADYSITDEQLSKLCTLHTNTIKSNNTNNNSVTKPTTSSSTKSSSKETTAASTSTSGSASTTKNDTQTKTSTAN